MNSQEPLFTKILWNTFSFLVMLGSMLYHQVNASKLRIRRTRKQEDLSK